MTGIEIIVKPCADEHDSGGDIHLDPKEVVPFEKEKDLPPKESGDDSRTRELIAQEERAANDYEQLADEADGDDAKEIYEDIADEEKTHAGELLVLLLKEDPAQAEAMKAGEGEVKELVGGKSFKDMFSEGRRKVEDKANGKSIAKDASGAEFAHDELMKENAESSGMEGD